MSSEELVKNSKDRIGSIREEMLALHTQTYYRGLLIKGFLVALLFLLLYVVKNLPATEPERRPSFGSNGQNGQTVLIDSPFILFGVTIQIGLLVSITALLIAGKTDVASVEKTEIAQLSGDLDALENAIVSLETDLGALKTELGFQNDSIEVLVRAA